MLMSLQPFVSAYVIFFSVVMMSKERVKNTATSEDVCRVLKGAVSSLGDEKYLTSDLSKIAENYEVVIMDLLRLTSRPNKAILAQGAAKAFAQESSEEAKLFANRLYDCIQLCKEKSKSMTSGKKLEPAMRRICMFLSKQAAPDDLVSQKANIRRASTGSMASTGSENSAKKEMRRATMPLDEAAIRNEVLAKYGMGQARGSSSSSLATQAPAAPALTEEAVFIMSSQECSPMKPRRAAEAEQFVDYVDNRKRTLCRSFSSGRKEYAEMSSGASGFALARFPGTQRDIQTEIPNSLLAVQPAPVFKRPAAPLSSKVAKKAREAAAQEISPEEEAVAEEGEEEDPEHDEELPSTQDYSQELEAPASPAVAVAPAAKTKQPRAAAEQIDVNDMYEKLSEIRKNKKAYDVNGQEISWKVRLRLRPMGCVKCRSAPGCTPCCYKYMKFQLDPADVIQ